MKLFKKFIKISLIAFATLLIIFLLLFGLFNLGYFDNFSKIQFDKNKLNFFSSQVVLLDNSNQEITPTKNSQKNLSYSQIPKKTINAFISIEDKDFYSHKGINYKRMAKALLKNMLKRKFVEGASTISQQLIKNTHLSSEKTLKRKFNELILTRKLEKNLTKQEIITAYLNAIYFGNGAFGINQAAQRYFSKNADELNTNESAILAGIIKSPKTYSPISNPENCIKRKNLVLKQMLEDKMISAKEYNENINKDLELNLNPLFLNSNNYYDACIDEACDLLKIQEKELLLRQYKINTYLDNNLQQTIENEINNLESYTNSNKIDGVVIAIDNQTGGIKGYYGKSNYNLLGIKRQPGSVFKPIISYAPALEYNKINNITPILDQPININGYEPHNYNNVYHGWVSCKKALANSYNIPSVKILEYVGIDKAKSFAGRMNIDFDKLDEGYSLAVGGLTNGLKIKDIANCYQAFANNGKYIKACFIKSIQDKNNNYIYVNNEFSKQVMKDSTAYLITDMLRESVLSGTCKKINIKGLNIAGKTGTVASANSNKKENSDAWNISYTPKQTLCVWLGSTNNTQLPSKLTGSNAPCDIARQIYLNSNADKTNYYKPDSISEIEINEIEYIKNNKILIASENTPDRYKIKALFANDFKPKENSTMFNKINDFTIHAKSIDDYVEISFEADKYLTYELFCENKKNKILIGTISNKQGEVILNHKNLKSNCFYKYYAIAKYSNLSSLQDSKKSNEIIIYKT